MGVLGPRGCGSRWPRRDWVAFLKCDAVKARKGVLGGMCLKVECVREENESHLLFVSYGF